MKLNIIKYSHNENEIQHLTKREMWKIINKKKFQQEHEQPYQILQKPVGVTNESAASKQRQCYQPLPATPTTRILTP